MLALSLSNLSLVSQGILAASISPTESIATLATELETVREAKQGQALLGYLANRGVATVRFSDLEDPRVREAVVASADLRNRFDSAFEQLKGPGRLQLILRDFVAGSPWPPEVQQHFKRVLLPAGVQRWTPRPKDFDYEAAIRDHSRSLHKGRLVYPGTRGEKEHWSHEVYRQRGFGKWLGTSKVAGGTAQIIDWLQIRRVPDTRSPLHLDPTRLGFTRLHGKAPMAGDLFCYHHVFGDSAAILTQLDANRDPVEILLPQGLSLYLTCPENVGSHRGLYEFSSRGKPHYLIVGKQPFEDRESEPPRLEELRAVARTIRFREAKFKVLREGEGSGLSDREWLVDYDFANGDWAIFHLQITGEGNRRKLAVIIDYSQKVKSDPPHFIMVTERTLRSAARELGFTQLAIYYKMIYPLHDEKFERELAKRGYASLNAPGWGREPGKRIRIT